MCWTYGRRCGMLCDLERRRDQYGIFKRLYTGEICPIESVVRDTAEYNDAIHKLNMAADSLERTLSDTQKELLQQLNDAKADIDTLLQAEAYRLGFMDGMEMKQDTETIGTAADR